MIEIDYRRWGIFKSKQVFFCECVPATKGYHFVIWTNCYNELDYQHFDKRKEQTTLLIDLTQDSDKILAQVHRNRRKMIRRGLEMGYEIIPLVPTTSLLKEFRHLYNKSIVKKGATPIITLDYLNALIPYMTVIKALYEGQTMAILLVIHDGKTVKTHRLAYNEDAAVDKKIREYMGGILYWQTLINFKQLGYQFLDFGGIESRHVSTLQGYTRFKISFGGQLTTTFSYELAVTPMARASLKVIQFIERNLRRLLHKIN